MTKLQEQIKEKKAAIESKKMYGVPPLTLKRLEDELKELLDTVPCSAEQDNKWANESI